MAAGPFTHVQSGKLNIGKGLIDLDSDTFFVVLLTAAHTPAITTHTAYSDISPNQIANGNGYTTGGQQLTGITLTATGNVVTFDANDAAWAGATITAKYAYIVKRAAGTGIPVAADLLLGYVDLNTDSGAATVSSSAAEFKVTWNAAGIFTY